MRFLHTMVRVSDLDEALDFYCAKLGLEEVARVDNSAGRFTLVFLAAPGDAASAKEVRAPMIELTHNWDKETYAGAATSAISPIRWGIFTRPAGA